MSGNVGSDISNSGMVAYVGLAVGIASPSVSVQKLFPLPVSTSGFVADTCVSDVGRCRGHIGSVKFGSDVVQNMGVAVGIASPSVSVQKLFPPSVSTSGFVTDI